jgi:DNA-binding transcriptional ArsR family regulator
MVKDVASVFAALADPTRNHVVTLLCRESLAAGELARSCGVSGPAMSRHLRVLRKSGLVEVVQQGPEADARIRAYRLHPEAFRSLKAWIDHMQTFWDGHLSAFKSYVEENYPKSGRKTGGRKQ